MNLPSLASLRSMLPGSPVTLGPFPPQPGAFQASEPGGASAPLTWIVIGFCVELMLIIAAAALGFQPAQQLCAPGWILAFSSLLGVLVPALLAYRSFNKHTAAKVVIAQAQGPQQAAASVVGAAGTVNVEATKP